MTPDNPPRRGQIDQPHAPIRRGRSLLRQLTDSPPVFVGLAGSGMMAFEGRIIGTLLVLALVALHCYTGRLLTRVNKTHDQEADWTGIRALTTTCCFGLPFYLALTVR